MALTSLTDLIEYPSHQLQPVQTSAVSVIGTALNAAGIRVAFIFQAPKTGTLKYVEFQDSVNVAPVGINVRASFQDLANTGFPDGTQDQFFDLGVPTSGAWIVPAGPLTSDGTGTGTKRSVTLGDWLAIVFEFTTYTSGSVGIDFVSALTENTAAYQAVFNGATWSKTAGRFPNMALLYDDGHYYPVPKMVLPMTVGQTRTFNVNTATFDEFGLRFQLPFDCKVHGMWAALSFTAGSDFEGNLQDDLGNMLATTSMKQAYTLSGFLSTCAILWLTEITLTRGVTYRLSVRPTTTNNIGLETYTLNASGLLEATEGGVQCYLNKRLNQGAWTDLQTEVPWMGLLISAIDDGAAGTGGSVFPRERIFQGM